MEEVEKSTQLKKCASLNNLIQNNQSTQMSTTQSQNSPAQRDHLSLSLFTPRTRRFSCSSNGGNVSSGLISPGPRLAPRVSQLRQEECADSQNVREVNHEREVHTALSISQSYEDLTLVMNENWSFKSHDEFSNPLHVSLPNTNSCSSPSPTSRQSVMRLCPAMSPSPTRRSFATRRSMSPIAMRPSALGSVKRKFDMVDDGNSCSSSSQPYKKFFTESYSRGSSPIMSPLPICPSPDDSCTNNSETFSGRITPKMFVTKAFTSTFSSMTSSPLSTHSFENDTPSPSANIPLSSSSSSSSSSSKEQDRMEVASTLSADSGVDTNGSELTSSDVVQSDSVLKDPDSTSKERDEMIIEDEITPSNIPMTL
jgi:hypothetical protein